MATSPDRGGWGLSVRWSCPRVGLVKRKPSYQGIFIANACCHVGLGRLWYVGESEIALKCYKFITLLRIDNLWHHCIIIQWMMMFLYGDILAWCRFREEYCVVDISCIVNAKSFTNNNCDKPHPHCRWWPNQKNCPQIKLYYPQMTALFSHSSQGKGEKWVANPGIHTNTLVGTQSSPSRPSCWTQLTVP